MRRWRLRFGGDETHLRYIQWRRHSRRYASQALATGDDCEWLELPGADHFAPILPWSAAWAAAADRFSEAL